MTCRTAAAGAFAAAVFFGPVVRAHEPLILGDPPTETPAHHAGLATAPDGAVEAYYLRNGESGSEIACRRTLDEGRSWSVPAKVVELPGGHVKPLAPGDWFTLRPLITRDGELHFILLRIRSLEGRPGSGQGIDAYYLGSRQGRTRWQGPTLLYEGTVGPPRSVVQLPIGRILYPFDYAVANRDTNYPTGMGESSCAYSDDGGDSWVFSPSKLTAPVDRVLRAPNYGALEPVVMPLRDGWIWMILRTPNGRLYESFSRDGTEWTPARPTRFCASNSPAGITRLHDGRLVLFWNNSQSAPGIDGSEPYTNRDVLHAAISEDEGMNWRGYREVYRAPRRNLPPQKQGTSCGTAYPDPAVTKDNKVLLMTGHGPDSAKMLRVDPDWLLETSAADHFANGLEAWCVYKGVGPIENYWRDRVPGASLVPHPEKERTQVLHVHRPKNEPADGAVWNFPMGRRGRLELKIRLRESFGGASIALADRYYDPTDVAGERQAVFDLRIGAYRQLMSGPALEAERWYTVEMAWDVGKKLCNVSVDGKDAMLLDPVNPNSEGACYLRLRSLAQSEDGGFLVESVRVDIDDAVLRKHEAEGSEIL